MLDWIRGALVGMAPSITMCPLGVVMSQAEMPAVPT